MLTGGSIMLAVRQIEFADMTIGRASLSIIATSCSIGMPFHSRERSAFCIEVSALSIERSALSRELPALSIEQSDF